MPVPNKKTVDIFWIYFFAIRTNNCNSLIGVCWKNAVID